MFIPRYASFKIYGFLYFLLADEPSKGYGRVRNSLKPYPDLFIEIK